MNLEGSRKRIEYIDVMKGIGILLVALGHSIDIMDHPINRAILSFHMPLFFFISGFLFYGKDVRTQKFLPFIKRKGYTILIPHLVCSVISILYEVALSVISDNPITPIFPKFLSWFLIVLFLMELAMFLLLRLWNGTVAQTVYTVSSFALFFVIPVLYGLCGDFLPTEISAYFWKTAEQLFGALFFGFAGMLLHSAIEKYREYKKINGIGILGYFIVAILALYNNPIGMYANDYGNKFIFVIIAFIGIASTVDIAILLEGSKVFSWWGQNSIVVYVTHFTIRKALFLIVSKLLNYNFGEFPYFAIVFILLILIEIPVIWFANKFVPFLFGKKKQKKKLAGA